MKCFSKALKKWVFAKLKMLWEKKTSRKIAKMSLKINGTKREFCEIPEEIDKELSWKWLVQSDLKVQTKQLYVLHKNKH